MREIILHEGAAFDKMVRMLKINNLIFLLLNLLINIATYRARQGSFGTGTDSFLITVNMNT